MKSSIGSTDGIVEEYLVYRGFTQSFRAFQNEKALDKTKSFEVMRIVDQTFSYIHSFDIESFINLWDFLNMRFFLHLDHEYTHLAEQIKADLFKYYLVNAKRKKPSKISEFFSAYSHEILSESDSVVHLRSWYSLPYIVDPERDPEFGVFFTTRWSDVLRMSLHNLLSVILKTAPSPKLVLLERWFHSEAQENLRAQVKNSIIKIDQLQSEVVSQKNRLQKLQTAIRNLVLYVNRKSRDTSAVLDGNNVFSEPLSEEQIKKIKMMKENGQLSCLIADECVERSGGPRLYNSYDDDSTISDDGSLIISSLPTMTDQELETQLIFAVEEWIRNMTI